MMNANEIVKTTADNCKIKRHIIKLSESISAQEEVRKKASLFPKHKMGIQG